jgi:hypothetical protein
MLRSVSTCSMCVCVCVYVCVCARARVLWVHVRVRGWAKLLVDWLQHVVCSVPQQ